MKLNKIIIYSLLTLSISFFSCDDLDRFPVNEIAIGDSFQSIEDARAWNNGMYKTLRENIHGNRDDANNLTYVLDIQADQLNASLTHGNRNGAPHRWVSFLAGDNVLEEYWGSAYNGIANINLALTEFDKILLEDQAEKDEIEQFKGEAYLARAFYYHKLIVRFAKVYNSSSASTDLGVPLELEFNIANISKPSRDTVEKVYEQILSDISKAKSLLSGVDGSAGALKFNIDVVKALEARVLFYMGDYGNAKIIAEELINGSKYPLITDATQLRNMWTNDFHQEVISALFVAAPNELAGASDIYLGFNGASGNYQPDFIPSKWVMDKYEDADYRKSIYFESKDVEQDGVVYPNIWLVNKYPGNPSLFTGANSNFQHAPILFRIAEMYLISAESDLNTGGDPLIRLNQLRQARNASILTGLSGNALINAVRDERSRELAFEGFRLDDLRRWNLGFNRMSPQNSTLINTGVQFDELSQPAGADKFTWGIPTLDITVNPNLRGQQNPGW